MNILFATSECAPFIKTGGLADVAGALPKALARAGHDVHVILPLYEGIGEEWRSQMTFLQCFHVTLAWRTPYCGIFELKRDGVTYWFVDNEYYFKRFNIYGHYDDGERFAYFSRAVVESVGYLNWHPDVLHCNDWQTALVPIYLLEERHRIPQLYDTKSVFTIHNIEYQGRYGSQTLKDLFGLNDGYFNEPKEWVRASNCSSKSLYLMMGPAMSWGNRVTKVPKVTMFFWHRASPRYTSMV